MNKFRLIKVLTLAFTVVILSACNKTEEVIDQLTGATELLGIWTGSGYYWDGTYSDLYDVLPTTYEYKVDGTGGINMSGIGTQPFTWTHDVATGKLTITKEAVDYGGGVTSPADTIDAVITKLDATNLWYTYQESGSTVEERFIK